MGNYQYIQSFKIKYCDVDFKDEIKTSTALSLMEEVACDSADELGFGYAYIKPKGYAFIVSNTCMQFEKPIALSSLVRLKTWPLPPSFAVFERQYLFEDENQEPLIRAASRWCLLDANSGKILPSKCIEGQDYTSYNTTRILENVQWKIPAFKIEEGELKFTITIANSEYDHNMHVNNTRYADYCFNCFSVAELQDKRLKEFSISYVRQCREGDVLRFCRKQLEDGSYLAHGFNKAGEIVVQSHIVFA